MFWDEDGVYATLICVKVDAIFVTILSLMIHLLQVAKFGGKYFYFNFILMFFDISSKNLIRYIYFFWTFKILEGRSYRLQYPWVGIVNRSQADINKNVDMMVARRKEREYFETSPDYGHLAHKMGSEYLAKLLSKVLFHP